MKLTLAQVVAVEEVLRCIEPVAEWSSETSHVWEFDYGFELLAWSDGDMELRVHTPYGVLYRALINATGFYVDCDVRGAA